ncbi:uncharacterized protein [Solanum lycopersicum]|uniref:uncharacterized protein n=1 Tax=Solanum lycopersicum TaxID=4081 RepID=UPI0037479FC4
MGCTGVVRKEERWFSQKCIDYRQFNKVTIKNKNEEQHASHLRVVQQTLKEHQLFTKFSKCYYRRFVEGFSSMDSPLTIDSKDGHVSMQGKVIAYAFRQLKVHKKSYPTQDLELVAVVFALKI